LTVAQLSAETPIGLVRPGRRSEQEESIGTLGTIVEQVEAAGFAAPEIAVIGNVVNLHGLLSGCRPVYQTVE